MINELYEIESKARLSSPVHDIDARVKLILSIAAIIAVVSYPGKPSVFWLGLLMGSGFAVIWGLTRLPVQTYLKRFFLILPFGLFIIVFQIFFENRFYETFTPIVALPFGVQIFAESVEFSMILAVKFVLCISWIILLSSTTPMEEMLSGARRLGLPSVMALSLGMMIRYLFVFARMFGHISDALANRNFNAFDKSLPYRYRLKTLGYAVGTLFLRSYEQGERTYLSMLCRGYGKDSYEHLPEKPLKRRELAVILTGIVLLVVITAGTYLFAEMGVSVV